jgi:hypothetical protein
MTTTASPASRLRTDDPSGLTRRYLSYDPIDTLPEEGKEYWRAYARVHSGT